MSKILLVTVAVGTPLKDTVVVVQRLDRNQGSGRESCNKAANRKLSNVFRIAQERTASPFRTRPSRRGNEREASPALEVTSAISQNRQNRQFYNGLPVFE